MYRLFDISLLRAMFMNSFVVTGMRANSVHSCVGMSQSRQNSCTFLLFQTPLGGIYAQFYCSNKSVDHEIFFLTQL